MWQKLIFIGLLKRLTQLHCVNDEEKIKKGRVIIMVLRKKTTVKKRVSLYVFEKTNTATLC